jgi:hypothetical protein
MLQAESVREDAHIVDIHKVDKMSAGGYVDLPAVAARLDISTGKGNCRGSDNKQPQDKDKFEPYAMATAVTKKLPGPVAIPDQPAERLPSWYHGELSRSSAETLLKSHIPCCNGLFLIRKASKGNTFVLSVVQFHQMKHYQITPEIFEGQSYLTFSTKTQKGPLFESLNGVVHYLLGMPDLLPVPLTQWVPCKEEHIESPLMDSAPASPCRYVPCDFGS